MTFEGNARTLVIQKIRAGTRTHGSAFSDRQKIRSERHRILVRLRREFILKRERVCVASPQVPIRIIPHPGTDNRRASRANMQPHCNQRRTPPKIDGVNVQAYTMTGSGAAL
jgi:hypothetical protein